MFLSETVIQHIAGYLKKEPYEIMTINLAKEGDQTIYNQQLIGCTIDKCWKECLKTSQFHRRKKEVEQFNRYV